MELGFVGLGRMGMNMVTRLVKGGHTVAAFDRTPDKVQEAVKNGAKGAESLEHLVKQLRPPRTVWIMVPSGAATEDSVKAVAGLLGKGDLVVDGGNSNYKDSMRRAEELGKKGLLFCDAGTSGGIWGLKLGYCLMVGGSPEAFKRLEPALATLAPPEGYLHAGPVGAGHFAKMIHNGIEYGMMQAYGEGFEILNASPFKYDLGRLSHLWMRGSVIRSWLLELLESAFTKDARLDSIRGYVEDSGEGRWTVQEAMDRNVPAPVLTLSLQARFTSRQEESFSAKVVAALRNEFGGHAVKAAAGARER